MNDESDNVLSFPAAPAPVESAGPTPDVAELSPEELHRLEVRVDLAKEHLLLWRIAAVVAFVVGLVMLRSEMLAL